MLQSVTAPIVVIYIPKTHGQIESFAFRITIIYQKANGESQSVGSFLGGQKQFPGNSLMTIFGEHCERIKIQLTFLCLVIHAGMIFSNIHLCGFDECPAQFAQLASIITDGNTDNLVFFQGHQSVPIAVLRVLTLNQLSHHISEIIKAITVTTEI